MQVHDLTQNQPHQTSTGAQGNKTPSRMKFRTSCDPCALSKVRCTKEQPFCSRCVHNGLKCIYGRSRRKGKPPSNKPALAQMPSPSPISPPSVLPHSNSAWIIPQSNSNNVNYSCNWYTSPMFPTNGTNPDIDSGARSDWERRHSKHLPPDQSTSEEDLMVSVLPINAGSMEWTALTDPGRMGTDSGDLDPHRGIPGHQSYDHSDDDTGDGDEDEGDYMDDYDDLDDPTGNCDGLCITIGCKTLASLYRFVRSDCGNKQPKHNGMSHSRHNHQRKPPTPEEETPTSDLVFRMTRSATESMRQLLDSVCMPCSRDPSLLLLMNAVLSKILSWYEVLYQADIRGNSGQPNDSPELSSLRSKPNTFPTRPPFRSHDSSSSRFSSDHSSRSSDSTQDSVYKIPLTIGSFNLPRATEMKMKAQLLLCELQPLIQVSQLLGRRVQAAEDPMGGKNVCDGSSALLLHKVSELQRALTEVCTHVDLQ